MLYMFVFSLLVDVLCCTPVSVLMNCQFQFKKKIIIISRPSCLVPVETDKTFRCPYRGSKTEHMHTSLHTLIQFNPVQSQFVESHVRLKKKNECESFTILLAT